MYSKLDNFNDSKLNTLVNNLKLQHNEIPMDPIMYINNSISMDLKNHFYHMRSRDLHPQSKGPHNHIPSKEQLY